MATIDADARQVQFSSEPGPGGSLAYDLLFGVPQNVPPQVVVDCDVAGAGGSTLVGAGYLDKLSTCTGAS